MKTLRIRNLRCLEDTGVVEIRPITILLGQNSSGKSTFLRTLPLLRQTVEARTRSPLLWFGRLVDFGDFKDAVRTSSDPKEISLGFSFSFLRRKLASLRATYDEDFAFYGSDVKDTAPPARVDIEVTIAHDQSQNSAFARTIDINAEDNLISIALESGLVRQLKVNGRDLRHLFATAVYFRAGALCPLVRHQTDESNGQSFRNRIAPAFRALADLLRSRMHGNTSFRTALNRARNLTFNSPKAILEQAKTSLRESVWGVDSWNENHPYFCEMRDLMIASFLPHLIDSFNHALAASSRGVRYIEPIRATADRFYRFQDLAVDEIDSQGQNLPMFIHALSAQQLKRHQDWTSKHFGFVTKPDRHAGHLSLLISETSVGFHNLADSGFGYSQILPIATQLWWQSSERPDSLPRPRRNESEGGILAIEQPELHLHPCLQGRIADAFVAAIENAKANNNTSFGIVAETHSEAIVNRMGELIAEGLIEPTKINVVLFDRENAESPSKVSIAEYDEKGYLKNWPFGFFNATKR